MKPSDSLLLFNEKDFEPACYNNLNGKYSLIGWIMKECGDGTEYYLTTLLRDKFDVPVAIAPKIEEYLIGLNEADIDFLEKIDKAVHELWDYGL